MALETQEIQAGAADKSMRLDAFLAKRLELSRSQIGKAIKAGMVTTCGQSCKASYIVTGAEIFVVTALPTEAPHMEAQDLPLDILFSDNHIAVINKPAGLVVHPGAGVKDGTLCNALLHHFPNMNIGNMARPGIIHRLDKNTSGIMVVAKTQKAHQVLSDAFRNRQVKKVYRAFCIGELKETRFDLKTGHARHPHNRLKFFTKLRAPTLHNGNVRLAHTSFQVLGSRFGITELCATLHTGRTHQIRAHLADMDHPLVGDELYGGKKNWPKTLPTELLSAIDQLPGQGLHAESLEFAHPATNQRLSFQVPLTGSLLVISKFIHGT